LHYHLPVNAFTLLNLQTVVEPEEHESHVKVSNALCNIFHTSKKQEG